MKTAGLQKSAVLSSGSDVRSPEGPGREVSRVKKIPEAREHSGRKFRQLVESRRQDEKMT